MASPVCGPGTRKGYGLKPIDPRDNKSINVTSRHTILRREVLAGSAAYAIGEACGWKVGLERAPGKARGFYAVICVAIVLKGVLTYHSACA